MFDWLKSFVNRWTGQVDASVRDLVHWAVHALAGVVYTVFGNVGKAWHDLFAAFHWVESTARDFVHWVTHFFAWIIHVALPRLGHLIIQYWKDALNFATRLYHAALKAVENALGVVRRWVDDAVKWVLTHVWNPLVARIRQLETNLLKWGFYAYDLLTHPNRLAGLLLDALVAAAEAAFWRLAGPVGTFALKLVIANAPRFAKLAETIVTAVL